MLGAARESWEQSGYRVHGATLSGIAAENLEASSGIESRTIASRMYYWEKGEQKLSSNDILVIDEAGMVGSRQMERIAREVHDAGAKLVLIGDPQQLQAIEAGASFRAISEQVGATYLTNIRRQHEPWQKEATKELAFGQVDKALERYTEHKQVHRFETKAEAKQALVSVWNKTRLNHPDKTQIIFSYTRQDVRELNQMARELRRDKGELGQDCTVQTTNGERQFAEKDRVYFLQNDKGLGVKNGTLGTIERLDSEHMVVRLDKADDKSAHSVTVNLKDYNHLEHGYAATIHKGQGVTVDKSYVLASRYMDSHATYVALSRHREGVDLFWSRDEFNHEKDLAQQLGRDGSKDISLDYTADKKLTSFDSKTDSFNQLEKSPYRSDDMEQFMRDFEAKNPDKAQEIQQDFKAFANELPNKALAIKEQFAQFSDDYKKADGDFIKRLDIQKEREKTAFDIGKDKPLMEHINLHHKELGQEINQLSSKHQKSLEINLGKKLGLSLDKGGRGL